MAIAVNTIFYMTCIIAHKLTIETNRFLACTERFVSHKCW